MRTVLQLFNYTKEGSVSEDLLPQEGGVKLDHPQVQRLTFFQLLLIHLQAGQIPPAE